MPKEPPRICTAWFTPQEAFKPQTPDLHKKYRPHSNTDYDPLHTINNPDPMPNNGSFNVGGEWPTTPDADISFYWDTQRPPRAV